ncbi:MAG: cyclopropane-fatty-acyl-phospholipid synthase [Porticoccaceae bacterium]|nr:MAG: cyclopropane-fatty-acyl-phospholipid synthase [Porticoccaceae bacterium]
MTVAVRSSQSPRIAVVGGGITGLAAALDLAPYSRVTLIEAAPQLGGHARTVLAGRRGDRPVDTGFIVFNYATYPHLARLFAELEVPVERSDMSFGVSLDGGRFEYALRAPGSLFAQRRRVLDPRFLRMLADILRFNARAEAAVEAAPEGMTLDELLDGLGVGAWFRERYLRPLTGAIWSTPEAEMGTFPARALVRFLRNHALLSTRGQHQWFTVAGGSREYVRRIEARLRAAGVEIRTACPVHRVCRQAGRATVHLQDGGSVEVDEVILAVHADAALSLLELPTAAERRLLGAIRFRDNRAVLHSDETLMPRRRAVWSSWVYQGERRAECRRIAVSYWMNRLQNIPGEDPLFVTLNPVREPRQETIYDEHVFRHPVFDAAALAAQRQLSAIQGRNGTWFAGAWARNGFHEDGIASARRVTRALLAALAARRHGAPPELG